MLHLEYGMTGEKVQQVRDVLTRLGYKITDSQRLDYFSRKTEEAVKKIQNENRLDDTGVVDGGFFDLLKKLVDEKPDNGKQNQFRKQDVHHSLKGEREMPDTTVDNTTTDSVGQSSGALQAQDMELEETAQLVDEVVRAVSSSASESLTPEQKAIADALDKLTKILPDSDLVDEFSILDSTKVQTLDEWKKNLPQWKRELMKDK